MKRQATKSPPGRYAEFLADNPEDTQAWLAQARLLARADMDTEALNAFGQAVELTNHEDCLLMAELFFEKTFSFRLSIGIGNPLARKRVLLPALSSVSSGSNCRPRKKIKRKH